MARRPSRRPVRIAGSLLALVASTGLAVAAAERNLDRVAPGPAPIARRPAAAPASGPVTITPGIRILYAPAERDDPVFRAAIAALTAGPVDYFDARAKTPSPEALLDHDCVMTWTNFAYQDKELFGDRLADFVDAGGSVVLGAFTTFTIGNHLAGRIMTPGYAPVVSPSGQNHVSPSDYTGDGTTSIHDGVTAYTGTFRDFLTLQGDGLQDGSYVDLEIAAAYRPDFRVVTSNGAGGEPLTGLQPGDWPLLVANACSAVNEQDGDGDGFPVALDCDDDNACIHPGAPELPGDEVDQDCDGADPCPCAGAPSHGAFVACVSHALTALRARGELEGGPRGCLESRAAGSDCGRSPLPVPPDYGGCGASCPGAR